MLKRTMKMTAAAAALAMAAGCAPFKDDRCVVPESQYEMAKSMFQESGSLDLVRRQLVDLQWRTCRINEAIYRLQKEFEVTTPSAPQPPRPQSGEETAPIRSPQS